MSMTNNDLDQIDKLFEKRIVPIEQNINQISKSLDNKLSPIISTQKSIQKDLVQVRKDIKTIINFFNHEYKFYHTKHLSLC